MEPAHQKIDLESEQSTSAQACGPESSCWPLSGSPYRLHPRRTRRLESTKAFHVTKDCSGSKGVVGNFCTIRSSNVKALKVGSKIFYLQAAGKTR